MNVGELKKMLEIYPDTMVVVNTRCSDYQIIKQNDWTIVNGVEKDGWVMRSHPTMSEENKQQEKFFLHLKGN